MAETLLQCYNKGCAKKFPEASNNDTACTYHPGNPVFHDALKGWSCCSKRSTDFTDFLNIPGCSKGRHNPIKPAEPIKVTEKPPEVVIVPKLAPAPAKPKAPLERPPDDLPYEDLKTVIAGSLKATLERYKAAANQTVNDQSSNNTEGGEVPIGTACKNRGCQLTYQGPASNNQECVYHQGTPIFHEGYKYWSCCQRRTSDFNEFLKQEGCTTGTHCWTELAKKTVQCRFDWHQTGPYVVISIFAKGCVPELSSFKVNPTNVLVALSFEGGKSEYQLNLKLHGIIEPSQSSAELMGSKVELKLKKAELFSWPSLVTKQPVTGEAAKEKTSEQEKQ